MLQNPRLCPAKATFSGLLIQNVNHSQNACGLQLIQFFWPRFTPLLCPKSFLFYCNTPSGHANSQFSSTASLTITSSIYVLFLSCPPSVLEIYQTFFCSNDRSISIASLSNLPIYIDQTYCSGSLTCADNVFSIFLIFKVFPGKSRNVLVFPLKSIFHENISFHFTQQPNLVF